MDGIHDMGGMQGFGPIPRGEEAEQKFHASWQRRVFGLAMLGGLANVDAFRHAIERTPTLEYLSSGYYGRWLAALERLIDEDDPSVVTADPTAKREVDLAPRFTTGARVRVKELRTSGHTRLPAYARGRHGVVHEQRGGWVFPDTHAHGQGEQPEHVYTVRFDAVELWGETAEQGAVCFVDLFESYLESDNA